MDAGTTLIVVAVVAVATVGFIAVSGLGLVLVGASEAQATRRRERQAVRRWTRIAPADELLDLFSGAPFGVGRHVEVTNGYRGEHDGRTFVAFDLALEVDPTEGGSGPTGRQSYTVVALALGRATAPVSVLRTESPVPHFEEAGGAEVVVRRAAFPRLYRVRSPDPDLAEALLHPAAVDNMLGQPAVAWRLADGWLLAVSSLRRRPLQVQHQIEILGVILDGVPPGDWDRFVR